MLADTVSNYYQVEQFVQLMIGISYLGKSVSAILTDP